MVAPLQRPGEGFTRVCEGSRRPSSRTVWDGTPFDIANALDVLYEVATTDLSVPCFLVAHPRGTPIWDPGAVPDAEWVPTGAPVVHHLVLSDSSERDLTLRKPLLAQLAEVGYSAGDITYLAFSHYHYDHTANANAFAGATWLVRQVERDAMFAEKPPGVTRPSSYAAEGAGLLRMRRRPDGP